MILLSIDERLSKLAPYSKKKKEEKSMKFICTDFFLKYTYTPATNCFEQLTLVNNFQIVEFEFQLFIYICILL
jgi:hypothetical protein